MKGNGGGRGAPLHQCTARGERAQAAGVETVALGTAVILGTTLLAANLWAVVDTRTTLDHAARDYLRAYTSAVTRTDAEAAGRSAVMLTVGDRWSTDDLRVEAPPEPFGPCRPATVTVRVERPAVRIPFLGVIGHHTVSATQTELVQPYGGAVDESVGLPPTVCDG